MIQVNPIPMEPLVTFVIDFFLIIPVIADLNPYSPLEQVITVSFEGSRNEMSHEARERDGRVNEKK